MLFSTFLLPDEQCGDTSLCGDMLIRQAGFLPVGPFLSSLQSKENLGPGLCSGGGRPQGEGEHLLGNQCGKCVYDKLCQVKLIESMTSLQDAVAER